MILTTVVLPVLALVLVFLFSIQKFSNQIRRIAGERFKSMLDALTETPLKGFLAGTFFTALIQSSTATTVLVVSLVNAGVLSFYQSLGVIFGANVGTSLITQLVAFDVANIAPLFIIIGFLVGYLGRGYKHLGKPIFYFGLVFLSLSLITSYVEPLRTDPDVLSFFSKITNVYWAIIVGAIFTVVVQASTVTSGVTVLLAGTGFLSMEQAVGIILGANLGTTVTALVASIGMNAAAYKAALAHFLFNFIGIIALLPFLAPFNALVSSLGGSLDHQVANVHLIFNVLSALIFLVFVRPFERLINRIAGS
ncbi:MAG: Na/Pi cotransporter family protein [Candidatus Taylorbacteria bacterium]|nr:Na/Pi cotransporter family protein [Candidatus Taylorbacteria bacterium]